jgi:hypothetical protein
MAYEGLPIKRNDKNLFTQRGKRGRMYFREYKRKAIPNQKIGLVKAGQFPR